MIMQIGVHCVKGKFKHLYNAIEDKFNKFSEQNNSFAEQDNQWLDEDSKGNSSLINVIQIYTHHGRGAVNLDTIKIRNVINSFNAKLFIHTCNSLHAWNGNDRTLSRFTSEIIVANQIHAEGLVFHLPLLSPSKLMPIIKILVSLNHKSGNVIKIILEMTMRRPNKYTYASSDEINLLIEQLSKANITPKQVGICIDTSHISVAPDVDITSYTSARKYLSNIVNVKYISLFHINGHCGVGYKDKHTLPFSSVDRIWKNIPYDKSGLKAFVSYAKKNNIPMIMEIKTPGQYEAISSLIVTMLS